MTAAEKTRLLAELVNWDGARCFEPLTNLAHAGEVLEAMRAKGWWYEVCDLSSQHIFTWRKDDKQFCATADSLQTAICHAALLAEGVKEEEL